MYMCNILLQSINFCVKTLTHKKNGELLWYLEILKFRFELWVFELSKFNTDTNFVYCVLYKSYQTENYIDSNKQQRLWVVL